MEITKAQLIKQGFTDDQITEIELGIQHRVDVTLYSNLKYMAIQMRQIRFGLEAGLNVTPYLDSCYDWFQMEEIRLGIEAGLPIGRYASVDLPFDKMKEIRLGLVEGIDLSSFRNLEAGVLKQLRLSIAHKVKLVPYINEGYDQEQLAEIREALEKNIPIEPYLDKRYRGIAIREIVLGIEHGVDVSAYADILYYWQQMREIRLGLEHRVDVTKYSNRYYTWQQMREIRLGLEAGLEVSYFSSLMFTAEDMKKRRQNLLEHTLLSICDDAEDSSEEDSPIVSISLEEDKMKAYVDVPEVPDDKIRLEILKMLRKKNISTGVSYEAIDGLIAEREPRLHVLIAEGKMPVNGQDGYYEYFFRTEIQRTPKMLEDGSLDYRNVDWYEIVSAGQKLAVYHPATPGINGLTVTGREILARRGKEQCVLTGSGFHRLPDNMTYVSDRDGVIHYSEKRDDNNVLIKIQMDIDELMVVDSVTLATGDIHFDGNVYVRGNVGTGAGIYATGDVLVNGFVESAIIRSYGSVMLRQGMNGSGTGEIYATNDVHALFFESVKIEAGGSINADYFMNCNLSAANSICAVGKKGSIVGGTSWAGQEIHANFLGNQAGIATVVKLGIGEQMREQQDMIYEKIRGVRSELDTLMRIHADFQKKYTPQARNSSEMYIKVENAIYTKEQELNALNREADNLELKMKNVTFVGAIIKWMLYENVTFIFDSLKYKTTQRVDDVRVEKGNNRIAFFHMH